MRALQLRIAFVLVASIAAVMVVAALVTMLVMTGADNSRMVGSMAHSISVTNALISGTAPATLLGRDQEIADTPALGTERDDLTAALKAELEDHGDLGDVQVVDRPSGGPPVASYRLPDGKWLLATFPPPKQASPQVWVGLGAWLLIVVGGVVVIALGVGRAIAQPFIILGNAVASVGPDGVLPHVPETGSREARHTARTLNLLSDRLKASMDSRMRLVAAAGHDLRTPMTRMRLRAEFLPEQERGEWLADLDELELIADSAIRLVREEGAGEDQTPVALGQLVEDTVEELSASGLPAALTGAAPATVKAGPLALRRALRNLITNAATHGGGARVALSTSGAQAQIVIEDDGPGIPAEMVPHVFEPFFRAEPGRGRVTKGAGLGLAIAREIVERIGGSIQIENRPEGGLRQTVTLRLAT